MASLHSTRTATKIEVGTRKQSIALTSLTVLFVVGIWNTWDFGLGKLLNFKWGLLGHPSRITEDSVPESDGDYDSLAQEVSDRKSTTK